MAVTATTVAAATTMLAAVAAVFLTLVLCFYIFLCAKRYRGAGAPPPPAGRGLAPWLRYMLGGGGRGGGVADGGGAADAWCYDGGLDDKSMAKLPQREVGKGEALDDCAVCITELKAGDTARVLPRCGHGFHVRCVDTWLVSHDSCPTCRGSVLHGATTKHKPTAAAAAAGSRRPGSEVDAPAAAAVTVVIA